MKILPMVSAGEAFMREDGTVEMVPMQVFRLKDGRFVFRLGRTTFWFDEDGTYDGVEFAAGGLGISAGSETAWIIETALNDGKKNRGKPPGCPYFEEGSPGWKAEVAGWPKSKDQTN